MELNASAWDSFLADHPNHHILQASAWGELKAAFGWQPVRVALGSRGAQILFRSLPMGFTLAYIPKGPVGDPAFEFGGRGEFWPKVDAACRQRRAVLLKLEPDHWEADDAGRWRLPPVGFIPSPQTIQPPRTLVVDLTGDEEAVLGRMKQKTRYNIKLALKKGIFVRPSADVETFHRLMVITGQREGFGIHSLSYYQRAYDLFHPRCGCELFMAEYEGEPLGGLMVFACGRRAWYLYGASADAHRERMPTYLLQWEAMRWARAQGCTEYDLWGVPDVDDAALEAGFTEHSSGLWGVYRFKRGFGGQVRRAAGPWDRVYLPAMYIFYRLWASRRRVVG
jgi:lipid II:glycine glycyltransferase (peptidoglycan interpeptide bridge formation enzyme)